MLEQLRAIEDRLDVLTTVMRRQTGVTQADTRAPRRNGTSLDAARPAAQPERGEHDDNITEFILHD
jgi:hypothetical protein